MRVINEKVLATSVSLLEKHDAQLKSIEEMRKAIEARKWTIMEFIRANVYGDDKGYNVLKQGFKEGGSRGNTVRYYDRGVMDAMHTKQAVQLAKKLMVDRSTEESAS